MVERRRSGDRSVGCAQTRQSRSGEPAILFSVQDVPLLKTLGFYQEEALLVRFRARLLGSSITRFLSVPILLNFHLHDVSRNQIPRRVKSRAGPGGRPGNDDVARAPACRNVRCRKSGTTREDHAVRRIVLPHLPIDARDYAQWISRRSHPPSPSKDPVNPTSRNFSPV